MKYDIYPTDTSITLSGGDLAKGEWGEFAEKSSTDSRKPASYAVHQAMDAAIKTAYLLAREQCAVVTDYCGTEPGIEDDGRIKAAIDAIREAIAARAAKLANQSPQFPCAGSRNGCRAKVIVRGTYCARCQHDED